LKKGDQIEAVERYRGVKRKDRKKLATIEVTRVRRQMLNRITKTDVKAEGFPALSKWEFIRMFCKMNKWSPIFPVTVIDFRYV